ncbi:hypothetical protein EXIGLDRAFT_279313 [Exidia glandulosa HHB12029]|uniref:Uncharacterized protein n=1 Tax=Exidia glandulosa HHB12029 TaxID=1314781 RepID=A0A165DJB0_EXIGL|nr:hypothetical protein EXIGLDRAFT_279313 [Exidia glandulosa HHB12029]
MGSPLSSHGHTASPELSLEFTLAQTKRQQEFDASQNERRLTSTATEARRAHDFALALVRWKVETDADELARKAKFAEASNAARDAWAQHEETLERDFQLAQEMISTAFYAANEAREKAFVAALRKINDKVYSVLDEVMFAFLAHLHN